MLTVKSLKFFSLSLLFLGLSYVPLAAGEVTKSGTTAAKFLSIGMGPRAIAMGGAYSAVCNDITSMYWNPAGLAQINNNQFIVTQSNWLADIKINYAAVALNLGGFGNVGLNISAMTMPEMDVTSEYYPEGTGETFGAGSIALGLTYSRYLYQRFMIGVNVKYVREFISESVAQGVALDIGTIFDTPFWGIRFSTSIRNFGTKLQMSGEDLLFQTGLDQTRNGSNDKLDVYLGTDPFEMPLHMQIGISRDFRLASQRLTLALDAAHPNDNTEYLNLGGELGLMNEMVFIRGGYKSLFIRDREEGLTAGGGIRYAGLKPVTLHLDYAFQHMTHLNDIHTFGLLFTF